MTLRFLSAGLLSAALLFAACDPGNKPPEKPPKELELTHPKGGEGPFTVGQTVDITWKAGSMVSSVYFTVSTDGGATWSQPIIKGSADAPLGKWTWKIGSEYFPVTTYPSKQCRLKLVDYNEETRFDVSGTFEVRKDLELINPKGGEGPFSVGQSVDITWKASSKVSSVYFTVSTDGGATWSQPIIKGSADAPLGKWTWKIGSEYFPVTTYPSKQCRLKLVDYHDETRFDVSGTFEVR